MLRLAQPRNISRSVQCGALALVPLHDMVQAHCFYYALCYVLVLSGGAMMILMVGVDRLFALLTPVKCVDSR